MRGPSSCDGKAPLRAGCSARCRSNWTCGRGGRLVRISPRRNAGGHARGTKPRRPRPSRDSAFRTCPKPRTLCRERTRRVLADSWDKDAARRARAATFHPDLPCRGSSTGPESKVVTTSMGGPENAPFNPYAPPSADVRAAPGDPKTAELAERLSRLGATVLDNFLVWLALIPAFLSTWRDLLHALRSG